MNATQINLSILWMTVRRNWELIWIHVFHPPIGGRKKVLIQNWQKRFEKLTKRFAIFSYSGQGSEPDEGGGVRPDDGKETTYHFYIPNRLCGELMISISQLDQEWVGTRGTNPLVGCNIYIYWSRKFSNLVTKNPKSGNFLKVNLSGSAEPTFVASR